MTGDNLHSLVFDDDSSQDTLSLTDTKPNSPSTPTEQYEISSNVSDDHHSLEDGDNTEESHICDTCKLQFESISELLEHMDQDCATGGSNCGRGSSSLRSSDTPDDLSLSPGDCPTPTSGDPDTELSYTVGVTENTPYGCQFCDKAFPRLSYLKRHEQIHSDQMPFRCDYCQRLFKHKRSRDRHVKLHTGDRKYRCTQCESAFSRSDHLKIHMKTHDNGKPYQCTVCNRGYNTAAALSSHMQNHKKTETILDVNSYTRGGNGTPTSIANETVIDKDGQGNESPDPPKPIICSFCPQICSSPATLGDHMLQSHRTFSTSSPLSDSPRPPSSRSCFKCLDELSSPNAACTHKKNTSDTDTDRSSNPEANSAKPHERASPSMKLTCGFCSKSDFPTFESLQLHVQVLHIPTGAGGECGNNFAASLRSLQSLMHKRSQYPPNASEPFGYQMMDCDNSYSALHMLQKYPSLSDGFMMKRPNDIYCSQCNISFASSAALLDHVQLVHEAPSGNVPRSPSSPVSNQSSKRLLASSRLRPNGAKHSKSSNLSGIHPTMFNGSTSCHYRRQDPGGGHSLTSGQTTENGPNTLLCSQCNAGFSDFESFRTHLKSHLDAAAAASTSGPVSSAAVMQQHSCPECNAEFANETLLDSHVIGHFLSATTEYGCQSCMKLFQKPDELQKHLMDMHAYHLYRCALCKQIFDSKVSIQVHFAVKHSNECRSLKCTSCSSYFRTEMEFQVHVKLTHLSKNFHVNSNSTNYRCLLCDQCFPNEIQLRFHASTHKKQFTCSVCGDAFHVEFLLDRHIQTVHQGVATPSPSIHPFIGQQRNSSPQPQTANVSPKTGTHQNEEAQNLCTKRSPSETNRGDPTHPEQNQLNIPSSTSTISPPASTPAPSKSPVLGRSDYRCDICDIVCSTESGLAAHRKQAHHIRLHKDHKCNSGPASSVSVSLFCAYCNESCKSRSDLENHMKAHTATSSKHKCNICDEICPSATTLAEHKLTHCKVISGSTCIVCRVQLANEEQFLSHIQQHNTSSNTNGNGLPVPCVVCRQTLVVDVEVRMHAKFHLKNATLEPTLGAPAPCCVCSRMFDPGNLIIRASGKVSDNMPPHTYMCKDCFHSKGEVEPGVPRCGECGVKFETFGELDSHRRTAHHQRNDKKTYQCIKCQMSFESEADIQAHVTCHVLHEGTQHECRLCHEIMDSPSKLQCHLIEHNFEGSSHFTCYICAAVFTNSSLLQRHMVDHGLDSRPYDCSECRQKFFFRAELENHSYIHLWENVNRLQSANSSLKGNGESSRRLFECQLCPSVFGSSLDLAKHQRIHEKSYKHTISSRLTVSCPTCGMEFSSIEELRNHVLLLHPTTSDEGIFNLKPDKVEQDLYKFDEDSLSNDKLPLKTIIKIGKEKKSFECPVCKKKFTRKENRKLHLKSHHQNVAPKTYSCPDCGKIFLKRLQMKEHMRTHITSTTHRCEICDDFLPSSVTLKQHLKDIHDRKFDYSCIVCEDLFDDEKQLEDHQVTEHRPNILEQQESSLTIPKTEIQSLPPSPEPSLSDETLPKSESETFQNTCKVKNEPPPEDMEYECPEESSTLTAEVAA
ncbi:zinc finger protein 423 isoform X2 [Parasteatoda tepidariorum]|uniref:zinc finger protein 423 isoform X2 n=1 Tax=Parasteatoda tepidariorum TaxID=114398 RepID=UPI001C71D520|nr:zinc finger protein 423 isoform X2 [Parasteatoda tepidariorum]